MTVIHYYYITIITVAVVVRIINMILKTTCIVLACYQRNSIVLDNRGAVQSGDRH